MPIGLMIVVPGGTQEHYDEVARRMGLSDENPQWPEGLINHITGPVEGGWRVIEVWESQEAWEKWATKLAPIGHELGLTEYESKFFPVHNLLRR